MDSSAHRALWERRQAELWERIFQLAQDVTPLADSFEDTAGARVIKEELIKSSMNIGKYLVRATSANAERDFLHNIEESRMQAIEADYWLRLVYVVEQRDAVQQGVSTIIAQLAGIIDLLKKMTEHLEHWHDAKQHVERAKVSL